jgi:hypothetical protein
MWKVLETTVEPTALVNNLINCITTDEDFRQELWIHYLSGNNVDTFSSHLEKIKIEYSDDKVLKNTIHQILQNPPSDNLMSVLEKFTDFERSIMCLLILGISIADISKLKSISEVRIRQAVVTLRYNNVWSKTDGIKNKVNGRRASRSK